MQIIGSNDNLQRASRPKGHPVRTPRSVHAINRGGRLRTASVLFVLTVSPGLSGCILGSERPALNLEIPATYRAAPKRNADAALPAVDWWRGFGSSELTSLMDAAQLNNLDIAVAIAQIVQADAQVGVAGAPLLPSLTGAASAEREHFGATARASRSLGAGALGAAGGAAGGASAAGSIGPAVGTAGGIGEATFSVFSTSLTASYMLDFWGKNRAALYAAEESATASRYTVKS